MWSILMIRRIWKVTDKRKRAKRLARTKENSRQQPQHDLSRFHQPSRLCTVFVLPLDYFRVSLHVSKPAESKTFEADASRDEQTVSLALRARVVSDRLESPTLAYLTSHLAFVRKSRLNRDLPCYPLATWGLWISNTLLMSLLLITHAHQRKYTNTIA